MKNQKKKIVSPQSVPLPAGCFAGRLNRIRHLRQRLLPRRPDRQRPAGLCRLRQRGRRTEPRKVRSRPHKSSAGHYRNGQLTAAVTPGSAVTVRRRAMAHPPKPAPVMRAPSTPSCSQAVCTKVSNSSPVTS